MAVFFRQTLCHECQGDCHGEGVTEGARASVPRQAIGFSPFLKSPFLLILSHYSSCFSLFLLLIILLLTLLLFTVDTASTNVTATGNGDDAHHRHNRHHTHDS